jgi:hypothetical protein
MCATGTQSANVVHVVAPAHFSRAVRDILNSSYHDRWVGAEDPLHGLHPLDLYLWGHVTTRMYAAPVDNEEAFYCIVDACQTVRNCSGIAERMRRSTMRHVEAYVESHGGHFEQSLSCNSQICGHMLDMDMFSCFDMWNSCPKLVCASQLTPCLHNVQWWSGECTKGTTFLRLFVGEIIVIKSNLEWRWKPFKCNQNAWLLGRHLCPGCRRCGALQRRGGDI